MRSGEPRGFLLAAGAAWMRAWHRVPPFLLRLLRIWALELRSPVAFAPMTNGLCCMYFPHGGFIATGCVCGRGKRRNTGCFLLLLQLGVRSANSGLPWRCRLVSWAGERVVAANLGYFGVTELSRAALPCAHGSFGSRCRTRDGHVQFWTAPRVLSSLKHLCRKALRTFLTTYQVLALPIPRKLKEFLTYRTF